VWHIGPNERYRLGDEFRSINEARTAHTLVARIEKVDSVRKSFLDSLFSIFPPPTASTIPTHWIHSSISQIPLIFDVFSFCLVTSRQFHPFFLFLLHSGTSRKPLHSNPIFDDRGWSDESVKGFAGEVVSTLPSRTFFRGKPPLRHFRWGSAVR